MAFFLSSPTSTATSLSSSPRLVSRSLESEDDSERNHNEPLKHRSNDISMTRSGFSMFGLLSRLEYLSGASASEISSLEESSESEIESSWTRRATLGEDDGDRDSNRMSRRSTREDARSPSKRRRKSPEIHDVVELHEPGTRTSRSTNVHPQRPSHSNVAFPTNEIEGEELVNRRRRRSHYRRHSSTEVDRSTRREAKLRNRRAHVFICTFQTCLFALILIRCHFSLNLRPYSTRFFPYYHPMLWIGLCGDCHCSANNDELVWKWK